MEIGFLIKDKEPFTLTKLDSIVVGTSHGALTELISGKAEFALGLILKLKGGNERREVETYLGPPIDPKLSMIELESLYWYICGQAIQISIPNVVYVGVALLARIRPEMMLLIKEARFDPECDLELKVGRVIRPDISFRVSF